MKKILIIALGIMLVLTGAPSFACTVFYASNGEMTLAGNNEDYINPLTKAWFEPAENGKYGSVFFGFDNYVSQGGMNEKGLFFDVTAAPLVEIPVSSKKPEFKGDVIREKIMTGCATVKDALKLFNQYQRPRKWRGMYIIGDSTGDSAIISPYRIIRKKKNYQVATNFYQSKVKNSNYPCERYKIAVDMLGKNNNISIGFFRRILAAVHQEGDYVNTLYSNIYDLKRKLIYLYHFHNFENEVVIDVKEELNKGKHTYDLSSLFPKSYAAESFLKAYQQRKEIKSVNVNPKIYNKFIGLYAMPSDMIANTAIAITRRGNKLYGFYPESPDHLLLPTSDNRFINISKTGAVRVTFKEDKAGQVTEAIIETDRYNFSANKIK
ncbi:MAG: hypothetical protein JSV31_09995 [Desulfobacterales bacterium]|nr:MAG: hypothetical protein JSV31_09995 [Desulfobacterales bacterium]